MIGLLSSRLRRHPAGKQIERQRGSGLALPPAPTRGMFSKEIPVERSSPSLGAGVEQGASQGEREALGRARLFIARNLSGYLFSRFSFRRIGRFEAQKRGQNVILPLTELRNLDFLRRSRRLLFFA